MDVQSTLLVVSEDFVHGVNDPVYIVSRLILAIRAEPCRQTEVDQDSIIGVAMNDQISGSYVLVYKPVIDVQTTHHIEKLL